MDKNAIKKYAVWARRELISRVSQRAALYEITEKGYGDASADSVLGHIMSAEEKRQRQALIRNIKEKGYEQVMEEVAYTWFNRFAALRFMEVNGYLPSHIRVFTDDAGEFKPQILAEAIHLELDGLDRNKVYELENANKSEELFKYLLIVQCNALNSILPGMFQRIDDYTELLLPDYLLREGSVIEQMVTTIPEADWTDQVQIIGWLYQYYNSEPKDKVFADLKKNIKITKENIPAATQLFTPDWIVHYMVENSLGRLWLEGHPNDALKSEWKYYLDEAEQEPEVQAQLAAIRKEYAALKPEEIRVIDPCMGSGHILCVLFDVLVRIYEDYGYTAREAAVKIVEKNLWGLDIDERATQLAYFAVMMKARQYDRRFFTRQVQPHVYCTSGDEEGENFGSLVMVNDPGERPEEPQSMFDLADYEQRRNVWNWRRALAQKYHVVVTNPPYMGASNMNGTLNDFIKQNYADYKSDFFSAFFVRCTQMALPIGKLGFFSPYVWMFIQSYEKLRHLLCQQKTIETLIQFEYSAFEEATVPVCTFVFSSYHVNKRGCYFRLTDFRGGMEVQRQKTLEAIADHSCGYYYEQSADNFSKIPGSPVAYWVSEATYHAFEEDAFSKHYFAGHGLLSGHDEDMIYSWHEIEYPKISFHSATVADFHKADFKYVPMAKGGDYRKWYGNLWLVAKYDKATIEHMKMYPKFTLQNEHKYFQEGITWTEITSGTLGARYLPAGCIFNHKGPSAFASSHVELMKLCGFMCSKIANHFTNIINPTITCSAGVMVKVPIVSPELWDADLPEDCIAFSKADWDSFETSWDFQCHPIVRKAMSRFHWNNDGDVTIESVYSAVAQDFEERFQQLKANEEELNRIFIDIYGLQDELTPEVEDKDVTVRKADLGRDIRSLISYAVGCMFGRYSLDVPGLVYAGGDFNSKYCRWISRFGDRADEYIDENGYLRMGYGWAGNTLWPYDGVRKGGSWVKATFAPDTDGVLPICDDDYFQDDITARFVQWVEIVFGKDTLEENLRFIADALGGKGSPRQVIRNYFLNGFYADHCKIYQKRPIYWLFDSGKKNGFKCLIYMHRYQPDTVARIRTDYVHEQQSRYRTAIADLQQRLGGASASERVKLSKQLSKLQDQVEEARLYEEKIHHLADQMIKIDLDDGVKHNYEIFKDVLGKIK